MICANTSMVGQFGEFRRLNPHRAQLQPAFRAPDLHPHRQHQQQQHQHHGIENPRDIAEDPIIGHAQENPGAHAHRRPLQLTNPESRSQRTADLLGRYRK